MNWELLYRTNVLLSNGAIWLSPYRQSGWRAPGRNLRSRLVFYPYRQWEGNFVSDKTLSGWALILGASSGFARLQPRPGHGRHGHRGGSPRLQGRPVPRRGSDGRHRGCRAARPLFSTSTAADDDKRRQVLDTVQAELGEGRVKCCSTLWLLARSKPLVADTHQTA